MAIHLIGNTEGSPQKMRQPLAYRPLIGNLFSSDPPKANNENHYKAIK